MFKNWIELANTWVNLDHVACVRPGSGQTPAHLVFTGGMGQPLPLPLPPKDYVRFVERVEGTEYGEHDDEDEG